MLIKLRLDKAGQMGAEYASLMARLSGIIVANGRILPQRHTDGDELSRQKSALDTVRLESSSRIEREVPSELDPPCVAVRDGCRQDGIALESSRDLER